jgi:protein-tyrosine phosphatase
MTPFTILHVCMGNICRSPMAERLTALALSSLGPAVHAHSVGTGGWHAGGPMEPGAARQVARRGGSHDTFRARKLRGEHVDGSDLVLTATAEQWEYVLELRPDAASRTFVLGEFGRLLESVDLGTLPASDGSPDAVYNRGVALVAAVDAARAGEPPRWEDDLEDPYGAGDAVFARVADTISSTVDGLATALSPASSSAPSLD